MHTNKTSLQTLSWAISSRPLLLCVFVQSVRWIPSGSWLLVSTKTNLFLSWELHLLDSTFVMFAGQAALLSLAGESKVFFKCLNRWLPRSLEVKIKTCAWGLRAQNAIYSSSLISSGIPAWGLMVLEAHAHLAKNNNQMVIYNLEVAASMKAFHREHCCRCKSWLKKT